MPRRYEIAVLVSVPLCAVFALLCAPRLIFGWHSRSEDVNRTKQTVLAAALKLQARSHAGLPLPADTNELAQALGGGIPRDAWGQSLNYQRFSGVNFVLSAMSPYPELLIISYDTRDTNSQLAVYPF
jgi:hypothetical protein